MAPRPASRYFQPASFLSGPPPPSSSVAAVWITDALLASAFARYFGSCHHQHSPTSHRSRLYEHTLSRRFVSNVPGPLESRRRLGKRQMTELQLAPHPSLPAWALPTAMPAPDWRTTPDLRQWQWAPPRDNPGDRQPWSLPRWLSLDLDLTEDIDADADADDAHSPTSREFFAKLHAWSQSSGSSSDPLSRFAAVCDALQSQLRLAALSPDEVCEAFDCLWDGCPGAIDQPVRQEATNILYNAVLDGIRSCQLLEARDLGLAFWQRLLCTSVGQGRSGHLAIDVLLTVPAELLGKMDEALLPIITTAVAYGPVSDEAMTGRLQAALAEAVAKSDRVRQRIETLEKLRTTATNLDAIHAALTAARNAHWACCRAVRQAEVLLSPEAVFSHSMATALKQVDITVIQAVTSHLQQELPFDSSSLSRWLSILAQLPQVRQDDLFAVLQKLPTPLENDLALGELMLAQWRSRGYVKEQAQVSFWMTMHVTAWTAAVDSNAIALAALALSVFQSSHSRKNSTALYISLGRCLHLLGRVAPADMVRSVEALNAALPTALPTAFLEGLAWAADDLRAALRLHELCIQQQQKKTRRKAHSRRYPTDWNIGFWNRFANRMVAALDDGSLAPSQAIFALGLPSDLRRNAPIPAASRTPLRPETIALVQQLAIRYALSDLPQRNALRGVENCRILLQNPGGTSPAESSSDVLRPIFHLITRDLANARPGRTTRLRWYLNLVAQHHGMDMAVSSERALLQWRKAAVEERERLRLERWQAGEVEGDEWC